MKDSCSRIRENSGVWGVAPKSHDFGYVIGPRFFPLPNRSRRCPLGLTNEFDRDEAMELFWTRGFEATGMRDLLQHMGIGRQSLYDTFGDKHSLFVEVVKNYNRRVTQGIVDQLSAAGSPLESVRRTLTVFGEMVTRRERRGCLVTNTSRVVISCGFPV
ncbi:MAG: TetR/AcrR family transcriptional regulator [Planctomycetota bacterium]|nr:TetR/AcrR family transcriptional regulator [Planctomycetota bacterium]